MRSCRAIVGVESERRIVAGYRGFAGEFGCTHIGHGRQVIGTRNISAFQGFVNGDAVEWIVGRLVREFEFLSGSQTDYTRNGQLLYREIVFGLDQLLLSGLQFYLGAQTVDLG